MGCDVQGKVHTGAGHWCAAPCAVPVGTTPHLKWKWFHRAIILVHTAVALAGMGPVHEGQGTWGHWPSSCGGQCHMTSGGGEGGGGGKKKKFDTGWDIFFRG